MHRTMTSRRSVVCSRLDRRLEVTDPQRALRDLKDRWKWVLVSRHLFETISRNATGFEDAGALCREGTPPYGEALVEPVNQLVVASGLCRE